MSSAHRLPVLLLAALGAAGVPPAAAQRADKPAAAAAGVQGVITKVIDGDSLVLQPAGAAAIVVRLRDIDAPEICQDWGPEAKKALEEFALGKSATLRRSGRDGYGRTVGLVMIDSANLSRTMVAEGHAWSTRGRWDRGPLVKEERMAQALKRGMHGGAKDLTPPAQFRKLRGPCK